MLATHDDDRPPIAGPPQTPDGLRAGRLPAMDRVTSALFVAPHADDEAIGCGRLLALLAARRVRLTVVLVSDGTQSHPRSLQFSPAARRALRYGETRASLNALGAGDATLLELGCPDGAVPLPGEPGHDAAARALARMVEEAAPDLLVVPWRRDPHRDHRASHAIAVRALDIHRRARAASGEGEGAPRWIEYGVWLGERGDASAWPHPGEAREHVLDIRDVLDRKQAAVASHRSQLGDVIHDDPQGFELPASLVARAAEPAERYWEPADLSPPATPGPLESASATDRGEPVRASVVPRTDKPRSLGL